jgi:hypothetical protein
MGTTGTLHEYQYKFFNISRSVVHVLGNVSYKTVEKTKIYILCSITFIIRALYKIMWNYIVEPDRLYMLDT